ncbi:uncharacterized protein TRIREDRAFT_77743 [Trichoderma reesei QM6a]|uniref:Predicted protein n=2 Tax=Hypocrea jecorina TaxID=51453 RepID=G0RIN5_HYPJQ|nr:uncharacterized protein TRIREDRAFT_77743 [Trichoderma reesei QM6a]EGR49038.1 predicted protein [Trichoderma reesei QM6a]ETS02297.1 hypothetical protein M419DRAFT_24627 [Trichoderma reesei RUT C-30]
MPPPPLETLRSTTPAPPPPPQPSSSPSAYNSRIKLPTPPFPACLSQQSQSNNSIEVQLPPLVAGALVASFAKTLADGLGGSELLLAHYYCYLPTHRRVRPNLDIVVDRLLAAFARQLWDELFRFYHDADQPSGEQLSRQVSLLFQGPVRQLVLILNGPETARCVLEELGPGLSRRPLTWSINARGIDFQLALRLLCGFWHREFPEQSPGGSPEQIARALHTLITTGDAAATLVAEMKRLLLSPHYVQMHFAEAAIWDIVLKRPDRPPADGFHIVQFRYECQLFNPLGGGFGDLAYIRLASLPVVTGTAAEHVCMTVAEYTERQWPQCGPIVLQCLDEALFNAASSLLQGEAFSGMSVWDGSDGQGAQCPGLRFIHVETEGSWIRMSVSAKIRTLVDVFQHMSWFCAAVSASPFPGEVAESTTEVADWAYADGNVYVSCSLNHSIVPEADGSPWLRSLPRSAIASGFPVDGAVSSDVVM